MALNIIDLIKGQLGAALVTQASTQMGESESAISKAISGLLPAVLGGMANHSNDPTLLDSILNASGGGLLGNLLGASANDSLISSVLTSLFGDKLPGLINSVSTFAGVTNSSSSSLLNMVTGATLGSVGKYAADNNMDRSGISTLLNDQKSVVSSLLPAGLSLASLGINNSSVEESSIVGSENVTVTTPDEPKIEVNRAGETHVKAETDATDNSSIWKWLLPLVLLLLAGYFMWKQCDKAPTNETVVTTSDSTMVDNSSTVIMDDTTMVQPPREMTDIDLNGTPLKGYMNGMESQMITFLKEDGYKNAASDDVLKDTWYNFDNVNFKMNSATVLEPGSEGQIENIAKILKAYPEVKIKVGGYTDNVGNPAVNKDISQKRADFIKAELGKLGVANQVTDAEGYGSEFATVPAEASNDERAVDRKMAVRFVK